MHPALVAVAGAAGGACAVAASFVAWRRALGHPPVGLPAVLAYHKVGTPELGGTWCTRRQFTAHLDALRGAGFASIDTTTFEERVTALRAPGPPGAPREMRPEVLVTFDDAYESFAVHAWPELRGRGIPVLLFVVSGFVGRRASWDLPFPGRRVVHLDWVALRDLTREGVAIGSHTQTHRDLRGSTRAHLMRELADSRRRLEDGLGVEVRAVSYPFGRCDAGVRAAVAAAGYRLGFSMCPPGPNWRVDPLALRRWGVYITDTPWSVLDKVDPGRPAFWMQDLLTRSINAVAAVSAASSRFSGARGRGSRG
ncbi:MAG: polysaccharide deacetylase family protein [Candidatus Krumholzibacteriia bacterium]